MHIHLNLFMIVRFTCIFSCIVWPLRLHVLNNCFKTKTSSTSTYRSPIQSMCALLSWNPSSFKTSEALRRAEFLQCNFKLLDTTIYANSLGHQNNQHRWNKPSLFLIPGGFAFFAQIKSEIVCKQKLMNSNKIAKRSFNGMLNSNPIICNCV